MSGSRQHNLPRFLLKGFSSRKQKHNYFCWVFGREASPFEANIINVAVAKKFYTNDDLDVDPEITDAETKLGEFVENLRKITNTTQLTVGLFPELLTHLELRTRHLRESFLDASNLLANEMIRFMNDKETIKQIVLNNLRRNPSLISDKINEITEVKKLPPAIKGLLSKFALSRAQQFLGEMDNGLSIMANTFAKEVSLRLPQAIKDGHIEGLKRGLFPGVRVDRYRDFQFKLEIIEDGSLVLGDSALIIESESGTKYKPHLEVGDKIKHIYLPISKYQLIIGQKISNDTPTDVQSILTAIAECSRDYFVSPDNTIEKENLAKSIGKNAQMLSKSEASRIVLKSINKELAKK